MKLLTEALFMTGKVSNKCFNLVITSLLFFIIFYNITYAQTTYNISGYCYAFPTAVSQCYCTGQPSIVLQNGYIFDADAWDYFSIFDIQDPNNISEVTSYNLSNGASGIAINGNYAYVADGNSGLLIFDISDFSNLTVIGSYNTHDWAYGVALRGNYAYVAVNTSGLEIFDVSDPTNPVEVGSCASTGYAYKVVLNGNYAYVAALYSGLYIIDISDPTNPVEVGYYVSPTNIGYEIAAYDVVINGNYANIAYGSCGLEIVDISNPSLPVEVGSYNVYSDRVTIQGIYAYVDSGNLNIVDISDPMNPIQVANYFGPTVSNAVLLDNQYLYLGMYGQMQGLNIQIPLSEVTMILSGDTTLTVPVDSTGYYEFTNLTSGNYSITPSKANYTFALVSKNYSLITADQTGQDFYGQPIYTISGYCYSTTSTGVGDVSVILSGDTNINAVTDSTGNYEFSNLINGNYVVTPTKNDYFFIPNQNSYSGLTADQLNQNFISIFTTYQISGYCYTDATIIGSISVPEIQYAIVLKSNYALIGTRQGGILTFVDISNPASPNIFSTYTTPGYIEGITLNGNYAYIADGTSGLRILDISNPSATYEIGFDTSVGNAFSVSLQGNFAYVADYNFGLRIIDISNPTTLFEVGSFQVSGKPIAIQVKGNYVYLGGQDGMDFYVINISNPSSPFTIGSTGHIFDSDDFVISGNYAYVGSGYFTVIDISNPFSPFIVNQAGVNGTISGITLEGNIAYLAASNVGFWEYDISNPLNPQQIYSLSLPDYISGIAISGNYAYLDGYNGNFYVVNKNNFLLEVQINLSGDTDNVYYTDTTGYYEIDGLLEGNYFVTPGENSYSFSPSNYSFSDLTANPSDQNFLGNFYVGISNWMQYGTDPTNIVKK
jgi:hypothetical protein